MTDASTRLRLQITQLQQQIDSLHAQLSGAQKRAHQYQENIKVLEGQLAEKDREIQMLKSEIQSSKGALDSMGKQMRDLRSKQTQTATMKMQDSDQYSLKENIQLAERKIAVLKDEIKTLSEAATDVLNQEPGAIDKLREVVLAVGDPKFKILNIVLNKRSVRIDELASTLVLDMQETLGILDELQAAGEVEIRDGQSVIPGEKYRVVQVPVDEWKTWDPPDIFDSLEDIVGRTEGNESIVKALETAVEILEQKLARSGALIFQMRRTAGDWRKLEQTPQNVEELQYKIREWKARALAMA